MKNIFDGNISTINFGLFSNYSIKDAMIKSIESHLTDIIDTKLNKDNWKVPIDYFSWGRDDRHSVHITKRLPIFPLQKDFFKKVLQNLFSYVTSYDKTVILSQFKNDYATFEESYQLMSDQYSKNLFVELILMKLVSEKKMRLSSFTQSFINSYEIASDKILNSNDTFSIYNLVLRRIKLDNPPISIFTVPTVLNLIYTGKLYRYHRSDVLIEVESGDIVIDAGVGWGDTTIYLAALANNKPGGWSYAFDILDEGMNALSLQCKLNPELNNITPTMRALSDKDSVHVSISSPSPAAKVVKEETGRKIETITIDTFSEQNNLKKVNFIKMDIEGAEVPALTGASKTINMFKPKLAISVYHKWDDLLIIPKLIHSIRDDYSYYIDCTTGFGGETVLYCK